MKKLLTILIFLSSCSLNNSIINYDQDFDLSKNLSFEEFKIKLEKYSEIKSYPNIDY